MGQYGSTLGTMISERLILDPKLINGLPKTGNTKRKPKKKQPFLKEAVVGSTTKTVVFLGPIGTGKSTNMECLLNNSGGGQAGIVDGTTSVESESFLYTNEKGVTYTITLYDVFGFTGYEHRDLGRLRALQDCLVQKNGGTVSRILYCYKWGRMTEGEQKILEFVKNICTGAMKEIIHVIVTHAPKDYIDDEDSMEEFKRHFSFLIQQEIDLKNRFTFVNLIDPAEMKDQEASNELKERWETHRNKLLEVIVSSDKACLASDFKATSVYEDWWRLNCFLILFFTLGFFCLVLVILYQLSMNDANNLKRDKENIEEVLKAINQTAQDVQDKYKFWIGIGSAVDGVKGQVFNVVSGVGRLKRMVLG
eukprot:gene8731-9451_t